MTAAKHITLFRKAKWCVLGSMLRKCSEMIDSSGSLTASQFSDSAGKASASVMKSHDLDFCFYLWHILLVVL